MVRTGTAVKPGTVVTWVIACAGLGAMILAAEVVSDGGECVARSLVDLRRVCTSVAETAGPEVSEVDVVRFYVQYDRS